MSEDKLRYSLEKAVQQIRTMKSRETDLLKRISEFEMENEQFKYAKSSAQVYLAADFQILQNKYDQLAKDFEEHKAIGLKSFSQAETQIVDLNYSLETSIRELNSKDDYEKPPSRYEIVMRCHDGENCWSLIR